MRWCAGAAQNCLASRGLTGGRRSPAAPPGLPCAAGRHRGRVLVCQGACACSGWEPGCAAAAARCRRLPSAAAAHHLFVLLTHAGPRASAPQGVEPAHHGSGGSCCGGHCHGAKAAAGLRLRCGFPAILGLCWRTCMGLMPASDMHGLPPSHAPGFACRRASSAFVDQQPACSHEQPQPCSHGHKQPCSHSHGPERQQHHHHHHQPEQQCTAACGHSKEQHEPPEAAPLLRTTRIFCAGICCPMETPLVHSVLGGLPGVHSVSRCGRQGTGRLLAQGCAADALLLQRGRRAAAPARPPASLPARTSLLPTAPRPRPPFVRPCAWVAGGRLSDVSDRLGAARCRAHQPRHPGRRPERRHAGCEPHAAAPPGAGTAAAPLQLPPLHGLAAAAAAAHPLLCQATALLSGLLSELRFIACRPLDTVAPAVPLPQVRGRWLPPWHVSAGAVLLLTSLLHYLAGAAAWLPAWLDQLEALSLAAAALCLPRIALRAALALRRGVSAAGASGRGGGLCGVPITAACSSPTDA